MFVINAVSQQNSADSTLVTFYPTSLDSISLKTPYYLDTATFHANNFDLLGLNQTLYSTLSNIGTAHKPICLQTQPSVGFDLTIPSFTNYVKTEKDLKTYLSLLPYSEIRYVMTNGDNEQHLNFRFGRQIQQGLYLSFEYNINYSPGLYTNSKVENNYFWINALYTTKDQRYRANAYWIRNKLDMQENGGIVYDSIYSQQIESDNAVILTQLNNANNYIKTSRWGFHHYFNLLPQYKQNTKPNPDQLNILNDSTLNLQTIDSIRQLTIDSIRQLTIDSLGLLSTDSLEQLTADTLLHNDTPITSRKRRFTLGRINHSFAYQQNQLYFNETSADLPFYASYDTLFNAKTTDTTIVQAFQNSLTWNSLGYQNYSDDVPFYLYAGINYDYYRIKHYDYIESKIIQERSHSQIILHGGLIMNLFGLTTITGHAQLVTLGYQIGDFDLNGQWKQRFGKSEHSFGRNALLVFDIDLKRKSPTWFETSYYSNHFRWENDFNASTYFTINLRGQYKTFYAGIKSTTINDFIFFNQEARPEQYDGIVNASMVYGGFSYTLRRFQFEGFFSLNKVLSEQEVIHLPLLQSRLKVGYSQPIFKRAATLHPSITVQYFTKYHADAYMPALRTFYLQNDVLIGNFPFIDLALAINVKQADIYVQYSNIFLLTGNHNSFIAPHYPMRDSKIFFGINWRLFN